jgi:hypothetical protein
VAISIKSLNGLAAIKKIGISQQLFDWLEQAPVKVALNAKEFVFTLPPECGSLQFTVPVTLSHMQKLAMGTLATDAKAALQTSLNETIQDIKEVHGDAMEGIDAAAVIEANKAPAKPSTIGKLPPLPAANVAELSPSTKAQLETVKADPKKTGMWLPFPEAKMKTAPLTKLRDANQMYQPVLGTSAGSRYYLVAANKDLRVAARFMPHKLSIRIEGPGFNQYVPMIAKAGIEVHGGKDYASIHLDVGSDMTMANKTLGAILLGLGVPLETPFPELKKIAI